MSPVVRSELFRSSYRDSVELMRIAEEVKRLDGISQAGLVMGTPANCTVLNAEGKHREISEFGDWRAYWASREAETEGAPDAI